MAYVLLYVAVSFYLDKLAHVQVVINCQYSVAKMCTREDTVAQTFSLTSSQ